MAEEGPDFSILRSEDRNSTGLTRMNPSLKSIICCLLERTEIDRKFAATLSTDLYSQVLSALKKPPDFSIAKSGDPNLGGLKRTNPNPQTA